MNASRLKGILNRVLEIDQRNSVQNKLAALDTAIVADANGSNKNTQSVLAAARSAAIEAVEASFSNLTDQQKREIAEINGYEFFNETLPAELDGWLSRMKSSPNAVRAGFHDFVTRRGSFIAGMLETRDSFTRFLIDADDLKPGESELEITLPRSMFQNDLDGLQRKLEMLNRAIRVFYELDNLTPGPIELKTLSTTDPVITVAVVAGVAYTAAQVVKLCLDILNGVYSVRKAMKDARSSGMVDEAMIRHIEENIDKTVQGKINNAVEIAVKKYKGDESRRKELEGHVERTMAFLLDSFQEGMILIPRTLQSRPEDGETSPESLGRENEKDLVDSLSFPQIEGDLLLTLGKSSADSQL